MGEVSNTTEGSEIMCETNEWKLNACFKHNLFSLFSVQLLCGWVTESRGSDDFH